MIAVYISTNCLFFKKYCQGWCTVLINNIIARRNRKHARLKGAKYCIDCSHYIGILEGGEKVSSGYIAHI